MWGVESEFLAAAVSTKCSLKHGPNLTALTLLEKNKIQRNADDTVFPL